MSKYAFNWDGFTAEDFVSYCSQVENSKIFWNDTIGCVRVGELEFDLLAVDIEEGTVMYFDLYVGGFEEKDSAHSRIIKDYPYSYGEGKCFNDSCISYSYEDFKTMAEGVFSEFIEHSFNTEYMNLIAKVKADLKVF